MGGTRAVRREPPGGMNAYCRPTVRGKQRPGGFGALTAAAVVSLIVAACGSSRRHYPDRPLSGPPAYQDAITVLASTATRVAIEAVTRPCLDSTGMPSIPCLSTVKTVSVLQADPNVFFGGDAGGSPSDIDGVIAWQLFWTYKAKPKESFLFFASYGRGGTCVSALYRYHPNSKTATFIESRDGDVSGVIRLTDRTLKVPRTVSLDYVRARMYPNGGPIYPQNRVEDFCPG